MITAGGDLATQPAKTGLAVIEWRPDEARLTRLQLDVTDRDIVGAALTAQKVGIDCPLGWPDDFIAFITAHAGGRVELPTAESGDELRRRLAYRQTDRVVRQAGYSPLSVAADRIGLTAIRVAIILEDLAAAGAPVDRSGAGVVAEVYPAASLGRWGLAHRQYKRESNRAAREALVAAVREQVPWLDLGGHGPLCEDSDDALDAVVAALTARAAALGRCDSPPEHDTERARREGWILLPNGPLSTLVLDDSDGGSR
ncbi:DUF429 domain-containing protein [Kineococcus radiotolerans]|uniref:DUF429 domain-containing protein n=1 Tax=Kineococcus radiotolerans (strain ATCC BAA-149 / DSM 14245 / SRS30216) TaxID=266940 RepID=A6W3Z1_KINRD|nr:DUF429 domain-containing protein [Kineococcus radiotolerans]ABS01530.1 conserved hypothetical protein [Kineococcus radiotolerans SRS30216 = ATCC BAA-149]